MKRSWRSKTGDKLMPEDEPRARSSESKTVPRLYSATLTRKLEEHGSELPARLDRDCSYKYKVSFIHLLF